MFPTDQELRTFLLAQDPLEMREVLDLWDHYSGLPGLLQGIGYVYNSKTRQYTHALSRRVISSEQLRQAVRRVSDEMNLRMRRETQRLISGIVILLAWQAHIRSMMKTLYLTIWLVSIGGFPFDGSLSRDLFFIAVWTQFQWLDNVVNEIALEHLALDGRLMSRIGMYGQWGNALWQDLLLEHAKHRYRLAKRVLGPNENHCHDGVRPGCVELALMGWMPIQAMIPIGEATCLSNCRCVLVFRERV